LLREACDAAANDTPHVCPICGAGRCWVCYGGRRWRETIFALLFVAGMGVPANLVPHLREEAEEKLPVYVAEQFPRCGSRLRGVKFYLQTVDLTKDGNAVPLVDDLAAIPLTLWRTNTIFAAAAQSSRY